MSDIPQVILQRLQELEPDASFIASLPEVKSSSGSLYFVKLGTPSDKDQYAGEAESLKAIYRVAPGLAPRLLYFGVLQSGAPCFISEYKDISSLSSTAAGILAKRMATELHSGKSAPAQGFGFEIPTYCGATKLSNGWFKRWEECYASMVGDLLVQLERKGRYEEICQKGMIIKTQVIPKLLGELMPSDAFYSDQSSDWMNKDRWTYIPSFCTGICGGNVGVDNATGQPVIFDPASYYGHNEADLSIARIFGGFPETFFEKYHEYLPKSEPVDQYDLRIDLYELFHYLNHTLLFGGHYASSAERKMDRLIKALQRL